MLKNITLFTISIAVSCLLAEGALRIWFPTCTVLKNFDTIRGVYFEPLQSSRCAGRDFDTIVYSNSNGFHDFERSLKKPEATYRIAVIGDSLIGAVQVSRKENISYQLEQNLNKSQKRIPVEVLNFGISGNGPSQYLRLLKNYIYTYSPDLVLVFFYLGNDIRNSLPELNNAHTYPFYILQEDGELKYQPPLSTPPERTYLRSVLGHSHLVRRLRDLARDTKMNSLLANIGVLSKSAANKHKDDYPTDWLAYRTDWGEEQTLAYRYYDSLLKEIQSVVRSHSTALMFVGIPSYATAAGKWPDALEKFGIEYQPQDWDFNLPDKHTSELCQRFNVPYVSLSQLYKGDSNQDKLYLEYDGHWSAYGHQQTANLLSPMILKILSEENTP